MEKGNVGKGSCLEGCLIDNHTRKLLPCFHVFCVEYLREFSRGKPPNKMACPRCQVKFVVPNRNVDNLPENFFGRRLERLNGISLNGKWKAESGREGEWETEIPVCDICSRSNGGSRSVSAAHCLDCDQYLCETCLDCHSRMRLSRSHQVLRASEYNEQVTKLLSSRDRRCETHPSEKERIFCEVCKVPMCTRCCAEECHRGHRFVPVSRASESAESWIADKLCMVEGAKARAKQLLESVEDERKRFEENVEQVEMEMSEVMQQMVGAVSTVAQSLRQELNGHRDEHTSAMSILDNEVRMRCMEAEQLVNTVRLIRDLVPDSVSPQVEENIRRIAAQLTGPPDFRDQEESWSSQPPRVDHFLSVVNEALNDDVDTVTGDIGELALQLRDIQFRDE